MKKSRLFFLVPYILWLSLFVIAPIILITINAFKGDDGFTLKNFQQFFVNGTFLRMTLNSFWYAFLITLNYVVDFLPDCIYFKSNEKSAILAAFDYSTYLD
jgi:ABC-type spermidine/putrescine transport system permease subunit I